MTKSNSNLLKHVYISNLDSNIAIPWYTCNFVTISVQFQIVEINFDASLFTVHYVSLHVNCKPACLDSKKLSSFYKMQNNWCHLWFSREINLLVWTKLWLFSRRLGWLQYFITLRSTTGLLISLANLFYNLVNTF